METKIKSKERTIGVRVPAVLYDYLNNVAHKQYKSISEVIRQIIVEKIEDEFTIKEWTMIEQALAESYKEKGINWRKA
ncbi:hypothetical protein COS91_08290 [Candidatus Desantisbacteria bacterium CG07_land_8_20_14_0_80_39_15]|uniref:CopG family transcriptional regulator n=1 Tax=Candidatus Desantisbacteria bacterium CG07_land_8_20_14_0_80_39_15 TaxID=1974549 RepID=A0A2M6ZE87_9BACT|nr:MAG: hypothetical protein COS91_08290 [Candidatus Desantisbacteria bacterium CG07_land_8_20_14_0_80_39_15]